MARGRRKKSKGRRSQFARFVRNQRRGCPTPAQIRRSWKVYKKWKASTPRSKSKRVSRKDSVAAHYRSSQQSGHNWWNPFGPQGDPSRRRSRFKKAARLWRKFAKKNRLKPGRRLSPKMRAAWNRFKARHGLGGSPSGPRSKGSSRRRGKGRGRKGKGRGRKGRGRKRSGWNTFFAKHRRRGMKPKAIGRAWRKSRKGRGRKGR